MTEKELLSTETFVKLYSKKGIEFVEEKTRLLLQAKELKVLRIFMKALENYDKIFSETIKLEVAELPKCKYDILNYNMAGYFCDANGITTSKNYKFSSIPIFPVERYINQDTKKEKIKLIYLVKGKWEELIVDKSQLAVNQKLVLLSDYGLDINSENVKYYVRYFSDILSNNNIKTLSSVSSLGWHNGNFIPYDVPGIFDGTDNFKSIYNAISSKGNYNLWKYEVGLLRKNKIIKILMAVVFASPLLELLGVQPYIVNLWSSLSGNGKTLSCMIAMSIFGNPDIGALRLSSNNTQNYYISMAAFMKNITCYFDELQIVRNSKYFDVESLVMDLCNGTEKGRLERNSQLKDVKTWNNNFLFTSNNRIVDENAGEQLYNRVLDLEISEKIIEDGAAIATTIKNNYGFAGREYLKNIKKLSSERLLERFNGIYHEMLKTAETTNKQANSMSSIILADQLACETIFTDEEPLTIEDIREYIYNQEEIKTSVKAKVYIINIINANEKRFSDFNNGECWGMLTEYVCTINSEILFRELKKGGFEFNTVKKEWAEMNFLIKNSQGRYIHSTQVRSMKGSYVRLNLG